MAQSIKRGLREAAYAVDVARDGFDSQPQGGCGICFEEIHKTDTTALRLKD